MKGKQSASKAALQAKHDGRLPFAAFGLEFNSRTIVLLEKCTEPLSRGSLRMVENYKRHA
jgi:hypothetical protein